MKTLILIVKLVLALIVLVFLAGLFMVNPQTTTFNYLLGTIDLPLSLLLVVAFFMGILILLFFIVQHLFLPNWWKIKGLQAQVNKLQAEKHQYMKSLKNEQD